MKKTMRLGLTALAVICTGSLMAQAQNVLGTIDQEVTTAKTTAQSIMATISWIFLGVGIVVLIYAAVVDSQKLKFGIISFLAAALFLTVGYTTGIF